MKILKLTKYNFSNGLQVNVKTEDGKRLTCKGNDELCEKHPEYNDIPVDWVYEDKQPEVADQYDYYYVPTLFIGDEKLYECKPGQDIDQIRENFNQVLQEALT